MCEPHVSLFIDNAIQGHAPELEKINLLFVHARNAVIGIGQSDKRDSLIRPVALEGFPILWSDRENLRMTACKFIVSIPQAR